MVADGSGKGLVALLASAASFSPDTEVSGIKTGHLCGSFLFTHTTVLVFALYLTDYGTLGNPLSLLASLCLSLFICEMG